MAYSTLDHPHHMASPDMGRNCSKARRSTAKVGPARCVNDGETMKLYTIGFVGLMGMFMMGCGLLQPAAAPVGTTTVTSASFDSKDDELLPRSHASTPADRQDPWDGTMIEKLSWAADHSDPWEAPAAPATPAAPTP
jgi:hypothetical protein